jgi:hypothetical protein
MAVFVTNIFVHLNKSFCCKLVKVASKIAKPF